MIIQLVRDIACEANTTKRDSGKGAKEIVRKGRSRSNAGGARGNPGDDSSCGEGQGAGATCNSSNLLPARAEHNAHGTRCVKKEM